MNKNNILNKFSNIDSYNIIIYTTYVIYEYIIMYEIKKIDN